MAATPGCVAEATLFQHPCIEDGAPARDARDAALKARAAAVCGACPLVATCLYEAVVVHDVAGFAGGTTPLQRRKIRDRLGIRLDTRNLDAFAGLNRANHAVSPDDVLRLRRAHPHATLEQIASRLGCSSSTVKRHLRQERSASSGVRTEAAPAPTPRDVLAAAAAVVARRRGTSAA